jgi:hypothetical protein
MKNLPQTQIIISSKYVGIRRFKGVLVQVREGLGINWEPKLPPENPSLPKENWENITVVDYGEYSYLLIPRKGECVSESE